MENEKRYCEYCKTLVTNADGDTVKSNLSFEKYVPHKYVYAKVCIDCVEENKHKDLEEHGFSQFGFSMEGE